MTAVHPRPVAAVLLEGVHQQALAQAQREVERGTGAGHPVVLHQRSEHPRDAGDEGELRWVRATVEAARTVPALFRRPQLQQRHDARLGQVAGALLAAIGDQGVERVHALAQVVGHEAVQRPVEPAPVERHRERAAERKVGGGGVLAHRALVELEAERVFRVEQRVEVAAGNVRLAVHGAESQLGPRSHLGAEEGDVAVVGVEHALHGGAAQAHRAGEVGGVHLLELAVEGYAVHAATPDPIWSALRRPPGWPR